MSILPFSRPALGRRRVAGVAAVVLAGAGVAVAAPVTAAPVCTDPATQAVCGERVVAEPQSSATFLQFDTPAESLRGTLEAIEQVAPGYVEVMTFAEAYTDLTGEQVDPAAPEWSSFGGRELLLAKLTDESVPRDGKRQAAISLSVHGLEAAGREGGVRYVEDVARNAALLPGADTMIGVEGRNAAPTSQVLRETETYVAFPNPDGWAAGDVLTDDPGPGFVRANDNGADLNRDYATVGWFDRSGGRGIAESEPETKAWTSVVEAMPALTTSTDIHGELTTPNEAFSDLIYAAGEQDPVRREQVAQFAQNMIANVEKQFDDRGVVLDDVLGPLPSDGSTPRRAANVATAYDIVDYDDSGFMGDWFGETQDSVHIDVENFASNLVPNNAFSGELERAHAAAVRGNIEATILEAVITDEVGPDLDLGRVGYVDDPVRTVSDPADPAQAPVVEGEVQQPYDAGRLDYFRDLAAAAGTDIPALDAAGIASGEVDLSEYDSVVVADMVAPSTLPDSERAAYVSALDAFAGGGGQLVLTDRALGMLGDLGVVTPEQLTLDRTNAGHVDYLPADHPFKEGLFGLPSQTYYEVMMGYPPEAQEGGGPYAPNYGVVREAWEAAGGTTVATVGPQDGGEGEDAPNAALGTLPRGEGQITIFGSLLPQATKTLVQDDGSTVASPHPHGLASHGVTIAAGTVFDNILSFGAPDEAVDAVTAGRFSGDDRIGTAATIARTTFPDGAGTVLLARDNDFADALSSSGLGGVSGSPLLLTPSDSLSPVSRQVLADLDATEVTILGGTGAVSADVERELVDAGYDVARVSGGNRYETAARGATDCGDACPTGEVDGQRTAVVVNGEEFPDAVSAGPLAYGNTMPVLLTRPDDLPEVTSQALEETGVERVLIVGGDDAVSPQVEQELEDSGIAVDRLSGTDRQETAVAAATFARDALGFTVEQVGIARGDAFPDALAAAAPSGEQGYPLLLTVDPDEAGEPGLAFIEANDDAISRVNAFGGSGAVGDEVLEQFRAAAEQD